MLGASYKSYALSSISNPALEFSLALLRIALIEETLTHGNTVKTNKTGMAQVHIKLHIIKHDVWWLFADEDSFIYELYITFYWIISSHGK